MNKYVIEDWLRSLFEDMSTSAKDGSGIIVEITNDQCESMCEALKHESYLTVNLEGVFEDDKN